MQSLMQKLVDGAKTHWCSGRRRGKPCDRAAVTYLVGMRPDCESGFVCEEHAVQMVATTAWKDVRHS